MCATTTSGARGVNNVPMQGMGRYGSNAGLQHEAMLQALPLLERAARRLTLPGEDEPVTIVEYGAAHGNNSIRPLEHVLASVAGSTVHLLLSDRPQNDFTTLSGTISAWIDDRAAPAAVFFSMVPRSFYRRVVPTRCVDLAFSLACLHHLEQMPPGCDDASSAGDAERQGLLRAQSRKDLDRFLRLRASELRSGATLTLSLVGRASSGRHNYAGLVDSCRRAMAEMTDAGALPLGTARAFAVPTYDRTLDDVDSVVRPLADTWKVHDVFERGLVHPAAESLARARPSDAREAREASEAYAKAVVDWLVAVCAGYFLKAVRLAAPGTSAQEADALLSAWAARTRDVFLRAHRDEPVFCCFIYVLLERA